MEYLRTLFPPIEPYTSGNLKVSEIHTLAFEECGNPAGTPVVFLHGGPGVGTHPIFRGYFDPARFRVILFSQRGCGKSTPNAEIKENDTWALVEDIEKLRIHLKIDRWYLFGGSWGSTLALTYAVSHSDRVLGMVLRGIFLGNQWELDWLYKNGASRIYPENWEKFISVIPTEERKDLVSAYYKRLTSTDRSIQLKFANTWCDWENSIIRLIPIEIPPLTDEETLALARLECHYMVNHLFFPEEGWLLKKIPAIRQIPCWIAQGRYDIICPPGAAFDLVQALPQTKLELIRDAGHSIKEPGIIDSLIRGMEAISS
jgi:proline iminopeptidase